MDNHAIYDVILSETAISGLQGRLNGSCHHEQSRAHTWDFVNYKVLLLITDLSLLVFKSKYFNFDKFPKLSSYFNIFLLHVLNM